MKKLIAAIISLTMLAAQIPFVTAADSGNEAYIELGQSVKKTNFTSAVMGSRDVKTLVTKDGKEAWLLDRESKGKNYYAAFDIDNKFAYEINDGSEFDIEIEYFSQNDGFFQLVYDSQKKSERHAKTICTGNTQKWEKAVITVDDAYFGNRVYDKYDFVLTIESPYYYQTEISQGSVPIRSVKITRHTAKNPITHYGWTDESGNVFSWFQKEKILHNEFTNTLDREVTAEVTYRVVSFDGIEIWNKTESITLAPHEKKTADVNVETEYCQLYTLIVDIVNVNEGINSHYERYNFAVVKTDPDGIQNENFYFAAHFDHYKGHEDEGLDVIRKSNTYGIRTEFGWPKVDRIGSFSYLDSDREFHNKIKNNNLHLLAIYAFATAHYTGGFWNLPETDEQIERWAQAMEFVAKTTKGFVDRIEIWNEPNIGAFNGGVGGASVIVRTPPEGYAKAAIAAYKAAKKGNPDLQVGVLSLCGIKNGNAYDFFRRAMSAGLVDYCDAITMHPYNSTPTEQDRFAEILNSYRTILKDEYGYDKFMPIWNSEVGFTSTDKYSNTEEKHADNNVRSFLYLHGEDVAQAHVEYNFAQKGLIPVHREGNFGVVTPGFDAGSDINDKTFVPRKAYVGITAMNYLLAKSKADGHGNYITDNEDNYVYRYNSEKFGDQVLSLWSSDKNRLVTLDLGNKELTYADECGNMEKISSDDGKYTFLLTTRPFYLMGKIDNIKVCEETESKFTFPLQTLTVTKGDSLRIDISKSESMGECTLDIAVPTDMENETPSEFNKNSTSVYLHHNGQSSGDRVLPVKIRKNGMLISAANILYNISETPVNTVMEVFLKDYTQANKWVGKAFVTNYSNEKAITGKLSFISPAEFTKLGKIDIGRMPRGKTSGVEFSFPELSRNGIYNVEYEVELDNGKKVSKTDRIDFTVAAYSSNKIVIDGYLNENEWSDKTWMYADTANDVFAESLNVSHWGGIDDLSAKVDVAWDEKYFYMGAIVTDNIHYSNFDASMSYMGDDIQFAVYHDINQYLAFGQAGARFNEFGISLTPTGSSIWKWIAQTEDTAPGAVTEGVESAVRRDGNKTYYEVKMPWKTMFGYDYTPKAGDYLGFTYAVNDNDADADGRRLGIQYAGGIIGGKNANLFGKMQLIKGQDNESEGE